LREEKKHRRVKGIRRRWMFNSIGFVTLLAAFSVLAYSVAMVNYYYTNLRVSLESRAKDTVNFISMDLSPMRASAYWIVR
jgi:hypothetical protein